jgi:hypothetical protein
MIDARKVNLVATQKYFFLPFPDECGQDQKKVFFVTTLRSSLDAMVSGYVTVTK